MFTLSVVYSSSFEDYRLLESALDESSEKLKAVDKKIEHLVTIGHNDKVTIVEKYARQRGIPITIIYSRQKEDGKLVDGASLIRNNQVIEAGNGVICFQQEGGSSGTSMMIDYAGKIGRKVRIVTFNSNPAIAKVRAKLLQVDLVYELEIKDGDEVVFSKKANIDPSSSENYTELEAEMKAVFKALNWAKTQNRKVIIDYKSTDLYALVRHLFDKRAKEFTHNGRETNYKYINFIKQNLDLIVGWETEKN